MIVHEIPKYFIIIAAQNSEGGSCLKLEMQVHLPNPWSQSTYSINDDVCRLCGQQFLLFEGHHEGHMGFRFKSKTSQHSLEW